MLHTLSTLYTPSTLSTSSRYHVVNSIFINIVNVINDYEDVDYNVKNMHFILLNFCIHFIEVLILKIVADQPTLSHKHLLSNVKEKKKCGQ